MEGAIQRGIPLLQRRPETQRGAGSRLRGAEQRGTELPRDRTICRRASHTPHHCTVAATTSVPDPDNNTSASCLLLHRKTRPRCRPPGLLETSRVTLRSPGQMLCCDGLCLFLIAPDQASPSVGLAARCLVSRRAILLSSVSNNSVRGVVLTRKPPTEKRMSLFVRHSCRWSPCPLHPPRGPTGGYFSPARSSSPVYHCPIEENQFDQSRKITILRDVRG